uniref:Reverse transcriptase domain-containing protein n=1 Tax=Tanacetum cinerariifolium TaxID=118510 RepID=A0A6L2JM13_TANCI|nr:reverse transcriptase domain-containing protein [Tanacetum cinerariifolium]
MAGPEPITPLNEGTSSQNAKSIIERHVSALKEILKEPDNQYLIKPILLDFDDIQDVSDEEIEGGVKGKAKVGDEDLSKPFKEVPKCLFTRRIIEFSSPGHRMFQQTLGGKARDWFNKLLPGSIDNWSDLQEKFLNRFGMLKACDKDPTEISKIISSFMSSHKCPELAKRFSNNIPKTLDELLKRVDDYLRSKEAFRSMKFQRRDAPVQWAKRNDRNQRFSHGNNRVGKSTSLPPECQNSTPHTYRHSEIITTEHQLCLPQPAPLVRVPKEARNSPRIRQTKSSNKGRKAKGKRRAAEQWSAEGEVLARDHSKDALVVEAEVEGYLVRRIHIDEGASVEIMFEHCFNMLHPSIRSKLVKTQTAVSGFLGEQVKALGKIELDVCFRGGGDVKGNYEVHSHLSDDEIPNSLGVATVLSQLSVVFECRRMGKKQATEPSKNEKIQGNIIPMKQILVYPSNPKQLVTIGTGLSMEGSNQLNSVLKRNTNIFAWEPSNMTGVPKRIIKHSLNVNPFERPVSQKRRVFFPEKSWAITKEVDEWLRAGIVRPRLVDRAFKTQIGRNLEAYVDDTVIKSKSEMDILADIAETFDNLRWINMKLNPKKCSFGVAKEKFLGKMQSLAGKLAALNRFLSWSTKKSLPFFKTLKDITKANKHDYRWTKKAKNAFQDLKKMILDLSALTTPFSKEILFMYLAISREEASAVLLVVRQGKQHPVHYVSRTLHDAERNYAPLEKMALSLRHLSRRFRRYFEAHPITVITDQPIKQILSKADTSGQLAPYAAELGAYNITYEPCNAIKGQVLANFINKIPVDSNAIAPLKSHCKIDQQKDYKKEWTLYTDGVASTKGSGAEYEALLAGLRIAKKMSVEFVSVKVDSKLVASQINETLDVPSMDVQEINAVVENEGETWMTPIINGLERGTWPEDQNEARALRMKISQYVMEEGGMDVLGPLPEALGKVRFVIVAVDYFKKWIEAKPLAKTTGKEVKKFVWENIVCRYGLPKIIVTDNGTNFIHGPFKSWCKKLNITQINTAVAHPQANGLVERANRSLMEGIKTRLGREMKGWVDELPNVLWAHRTSLKTKNKETLYSLTFGSEAVIQA